MVMPNITIAATMTAVLITQRSVGQIHPPQTTLPQKGQSAPIGRAARASLKCTVLIS